MHTFIVSEKYPVRDMMMIMHMLIRICLRTLLNTSTQEHITSGTGPYATTEFGRSLPCPNVNSQEKQIRVKIRRKVLPSLTIYYHPVPEAQQTLLGFLQARSYFAFGSTERSISSELTDSYRPAHTTVQSEQKTSEGAGSYSGGIWVLSSGSADLYVLYFPFSCCHPLDISSVLTVLWLSL